MEFARSRSAVRWTAVALSAAWIATVFPALPFPYSSQPPRPFGELPGWCAWVLTQGVKFGTIAGGLGWVAWAKATGAMKNADLHFMSLTARAWFSGAMDWGGLLGILMAAAVPPWLLCVPIRLVARRGGTDPAFVVAGGWSVALLVAFSAVVGTELLRPNPSVLMLPPLRAGTTDTHAPPPEWCTYSFHARARECETALADTRRDGAHGIGGFGFRGARCVPVGERVHPRLDAVAHVSGTLERILAQRATVHRDHRIADDRVDVVAVGPGGDVLLAVDVVERGVGTDHDRRTGRLAAAAVPEYWRLEIHPNQDSVTPDMLHVAKVRDVETGRYTSYGSSSRDPDAHLRLTALPDVQIPIAEVMPSMPCEPRRAAPATPTQTACAGIVFVVDGSVPSPTLAFSDPGGGGIATRLHFTATSEAMPRDLHPAITGLAIRIRVVYPEQNLLDVLLPAGGAWTHGNRDDSSWTYRDPDGRVAGLTDVAVRAVERGRLAWDIRGARGAYRTRPDVGSWASIAVGIAPPANDDSPPCGAVFFPVTEGHCRQEEAGSLTCKGPSPAQVCSGDGPDGLIQCAVEQVAHAEEVFFAHAGRYFTGNCASFLDRELPQGVSCLTTSRGLGFGVSAVHARMSYRTGCRWESPSMNGEAPMTCS